MEEPLKTIKLLIATPMMPPEIGGPATYATLLGEKLPSRGFSLIMVNFADFKKYPKILRHFLYTLALIWRGRSSDLLLALDPVSVGLPAVVASKIVRSKLVVKIVGDYAWEQGTNRFGVKDMLDYFVQANPKQYSLPVRILKGVQTFVAKQAYVIVTPSKYLKNIVRQWGVSTDKISVIYNAFSLDYEPVSKRELRLLLDMKGTVLLSAGRLVPWKGFEVLIKVFADLATNIPDLKLFIAGDGPERETLAALIKNLRLTEKVILLGKLPHAELLKYIKASDIFVLNTGYEGFSHQLLEVMAMGTPLITTKVGGNPELVEQGRSGLLVDYNDALGLRQAITTLIEHPLEAERMAHNAKEKVNQFTETHLLDAVAKLFRQLV